MKTVKLIYPQWQGGDITRWIPEIGDAGVAARGYYLGAQLLDFLSPDNGMEALTVPVRVDKCERVSTDGILDRDDIAIQTKAALDMLDVANPDRIVTLGGGMLGECRSFYMACEKNMRAMLQWSGLMRTPT